MNKLVVTGLLFCAILSFAMTKIDKKNLLKKESWKAVYDSTQIDPVLLEQIRGKIGDGLRIDVVFAFWCPDSKHNVPPFVKIIDALNDPRIQVDYYEVGRKSGRYYVDEWKVERIPTFIFTRNGGEIGRIIENPEKSMLEDMLAILMGIS